MPLSDRHVRSQVSLIRDWARNVDLDEASLERLTSTQRLSKVLSLANGITCMPYYSFYDTRLAPSCRKVGYAEECHPDNRQFYASRAGDFDSARVSRPDNGRFHTL